jgi:hypothetical protein
VDDVRAVTKIGLRDRWHTILQYKRPTHYNAKFLAIFYELHDEQKHEIMNKNNHQEENE